MFNRVRRGWLRRAITLLRWSRVLGYVAISCAGIAALVFPPRSLADASGEGITVQIVWAALMGLSGMCCAYGAARDVWVGEYVGLIPLAWTAAAFSVSALARGQMGWAGGLFLAGFFWLLVSRWQEVALLRTEANRHARNGGEGEGATRPGGEGGRS